ncbi:uncharacterized protein G2W53_010887 [Senna tora]|uniref:Uncharacterized protein n=1 Tax=Senna tora TaxID=362788 RepID=A0A834X0Q9_9FABA|nr:uncharacterized protein G2W53_010887 [Senna tora]
MVEIWSIGRREGDVGASEVTEVAGEKS